MAVWHDDLFYLSSNKYSIFEYYDIDDERPA